MNIIILTDSSTYETRGMCVAGVLHAEGHHVTLIGTDFDHRAKQKGREASGGQIYLDMLPYQKNLSLKRLYAHADFAKKAAAELEQHKIDLLYVMIPGNSLAKTAARYKEKHPQTKLIFDIIDLWPEALPFGRWKDNFLTRIWKYMRDRYLPCADLILTECTLYQQILKEALQGKQVRTLYWPQQSEEEKADKTDKVDTAYTDIAPLETANTGRLGICYLGSVNHIIDIKCICELLKEINALREIEVHIIGTGERIDTFLSGLKVEGIHTIYHGAVYDAEEKERIMRQCSYGINIMKPSVCVGLTMKSVEYLYHGLFLLNTIKGDTWEIVEQYRLGINCSVEMLKTAARLTVPISKEDRVRAKFVYDLLFSEEAFERQVKDCILPLLEGNREE